MTLLFKKPFLKQIREGKKTQTRRLRRPNIKIGKTYHLRQNYHENLPDEILIIDIFQQTLGAISHEDSICEGFSSVNEFKKAWTCIYGEYDPHAYIWVIEFKHIGETDRFKQKSSG